MTIDITNSICYELPALRDNEARHFNYGKGWSFFSVYHLRELRDVYILLRLEGYTKKRIFIDNVESLIEPVKSDWLDRRVQEYLNALVLLGLVDSEYSLLKDYFKEAKINSPLSESDKKEFKNLFYNYFRFKEIFTWFIDPSNDFHDNNFATIDEASIKENSHPIFYFSNNTRFTDSIIYSLSEHPDIYKFPNGMEHLMRFWDVFLKWGITLKQIEKFNLSNFEIKLIGRKEKDISCCYFISNSRLENVDLENFLKKEFSSKYIFIPDIIFRLAIKTRCSIDFIRNFILENVKSSSQYYTYERTSEVFITKELEGKSAEEIMRFFPLYKDSYISHIILR